MATIPAEATEPAGTREGILRGMLVEFDTPGQLIAAANRVREAGYKRFDAHSPFPIHGIDEAVGIRMTILPWIVMAGGMFGLLNGLFLQWYTNAVDAESLSLIPTFLQGYNYLVSGKPYFSLPANIPVIFELTILLSAIAAVIGMLVLNNLPLFYNPVFNVARFRKVTDDKFFLVVDARDSKFDARATDELLSGLGGTAVEPILEYPSPSALPRPFLTLGVIVTLVALIPPALIWKAWVSKSSKPRIHIIQDMDNQAKFKDQRASVLFADGRSMRPPVPGTVARGDLQHDDHFFRGIVGEAWSTTFPLHKLPVDDALLDRGQQRFGVYCAPCHGLTGDGQGLVNQRAIELGGAWVPPANLHEAQYRERALGHLFNTISNGIRSMPQYGDAIPPADRWAIVAYVRALQRSQFATIDDVPAAERAQMPSAARPAEATEE